jgi:hypothetical protein
MTDLKKAIESTRRLVTLAFWACVFIALTSFFTLFAGATIYMVYQMDGLVERQAVHNDKVSAEIAAFTNYLRDLRSEMVKQTRDTRTRGRAIGG